MDITDLQVEGYERVAKAVDSDSGLRALISVHSTALGPALGGMRMWPYESEEAALTDVLRLSKGMTYKSAVAHTGLGGGKAVIIGAPREIKSEALFLAMGRFVDAFEGKYITAEDVNITVPDLEIVRRSTKYVTGLLEKDGGSGNPSPYTAYGVYLGIRAALGWKLGDDSVKGRSVAVQGVGAVGSELCRRLRNGGATVFISDQKADRVQALVDEIGAEAVESDVITELDVDVLAPCALGAIVNDKSMEKFRCKIIAGAANNVLHEERHGRELRERGILYAPDYVINAGGIINVAGELSAEGYDQDRSLTRIERIPQALKEVWTIAEQEGIPASDAADHLAEKILSQAV
ncbi:MAG: Glu/Leu/Phe/Val dehydrogenase dimerization domain-containing protein [Planctomycetota bacterium]|jgi:leucine dehydrogenase